MRSLIDTIFEFLKCLDSKILIVDINNSSLKKNYLNFKVERGLNMSMYDFFLKNPQNLSRWEVYHRVQKSILNNTGFADN